MDWRSHWPKKGGLFNDAKADEVLHGRGISELEMMWKEGVVTYFKILSQHMPVGTEETCPALVRVAHFQPKLRTWHLQT
jgi:hypothetical protein